MNAQAGRIAAGIANDVEKGRNRVAGAARSLAATVACLLLAPPTAPAGTSPAPDGDRVQCANLVYAVNKSSVCFSDRFLKRLEMETKVRTEARFDRVRLDDARHLANYPFAIMTGEGAFALTEPERANLAYFVRHGGFLVASAGCSDAEWIRSFRREFARTFRGGQLRSLPLTHPIYRTVYLIRSLETTHQRRGAQGAELEGYSINGRLALVFSSDGLNDTTHAENCCCCTGDEIANAEYINVNLLAYALLH